MTAPARPPRSLFVGTFLICAALLAFEVSSVRTINFALGPSYIFVAIALAMLGLTAAGSLLSLFDLTRARTRTNVILAILSVLIAVLIVLCHLYIATTKETINAAIRSAGETGGEQAIFQYLLFSGPGQAARVGAALTVPYFLFGALLSVLFARGAARDYAALYAADLFGAAVGAVAIVVLMETTSYESSVLAPALCAALAACAFAWSTHRKFATVGMAATVVSALVIATTPLGRAVSLGGDPNYLVRDYTMSSNQVERWSGWNSYTRVAAIERADAPGQGAVLSLANGDGMAFLMPYDPADAAPTIHPPVIPALISGPADDALVIFAGAGADLMSLRASGVQRTVGVELNKRLVEAGLSLPEYKLQDFLDQDGVELHVEEARAFLERDDRLYDMVLVSWSGATLVFRMGALGGTTDYVFTYQGMSAVLDRVAPGGRAVILQVNKLDMIAGLHRYFGEREIETDPAQAVIILYKDSMNHIWNAPWDDNPMLVKPLGWSASEVAQITERAASHGFQVAYAPGAPINPKFETYHRVLTAADPNAEMRQISGEQNKRFGIATDDRPFHLDHFNPARYLRAEFWGFVAASRDEPADVFHFIRVVITVALAVVAFALAIAPLAYGRRKVQSRRRSAVYLGYFMALGAGFMFVEIGLIQRTSILLGNPGLTIAVVLCAVILSTGIGSLISNASMARGLTLRAISLSVVAYSVLVALATPPIVTALMGAPLAVNIVAIGLIVAPGGILMGHLFPQGLAYAQSEDVTLVPWAWAINGAMSASVAGFAPLLAQVTGFASLFYIGAVLYALAAFLPVAHNLAHPAPQTA